MSSGFAGVTWEQARDRGSSSAFTGGMAGGGFGGSGRGGGGARGGASATVMPETVNMPLPNGIEIHGYAVDEGVLLDYITELKERDEFVDVYLDERSVNQRRVTELGRASITATVAGSQTVVSFVLLVQISGQPLNATEVGSTGRIGGGAGAPGAFGQGGLRGGGLRGGGLDGGGFRGGGLRGFGQRDQR